MHSFPIKASQRTHAGPTETMHRKKIYTEIHVALTRESLSMPIFSCMTRLSFDFVRRSSSSRSDSFLRNSDSSVWALSLPSRRELISVRRRASTWAERELSRASAFDDSTARSKFCNWSKTRTRHHKSAYFRKIFCPAYPGRPFLLTDSEARLCSSMDCSR